MLDLKPELRVSENPGPLKFHAGPNSEILVDRTTMKKGPVKDKLTSAFARPQADSSKILRLKLLMGNLGFAFRVEGSGCTISGARIRVI